MLQRCASFSEGLAELRGLYGAGRACLAGAAVPFGGLMGGVLQVQALHASACGWAQLSRSQLVPGDCLG